MCWARRLSALVLGAWLLLEVAVRVVVLHSFTHLGAASAAPDA